MDDSPPSRASARAVSALAVAAGALAGLLDAIVAMARGHANVSLLLPIQTASFGAALAAIVALPFALGLTLADRPRSAGRRMGVVLGALAATPAGLLLARAMHKRIPWDAADAGAAALGLVALAVGIAGVAEIVARGLGRRAEGLARTMHRLAPLLAVILAPAALHAARMLRPAPGGAGAGDATSILLLTVDTLRGDRLGAAGDPRARTPWIDRLARGGLQQETCVAPSPWTLPSLASLHTGALPGRHRVLEEVSRLADDVPTLAECCRAAGLRTAAFVSNPWLAAGALGRGFDVFDVAERPALLDPIRGTRMSIGATKAMLRVMSLDDGRRLARRGAQWFRRGSGPYFLWVHWFDPHLPNWPPAPFDRLDGRPPRLARAALTVEEIRAGDFPGGEAGRREIEQLYQGEVAYTDHAIGGLLRSLEASGGLDRTVVVFSADHGEEFWEHGGYGHGHSMYDEVLRVPCIVRLPGGANGRVGRGLARLVDLAPTALAAAGIEPDPERPFFGVDLLGMAPPASTFGEGVLYGPEQKYLRTTRWKFVAGAADSGRLFDLESDPGERSDLLSTAPAAADSLKGLLAAWRIEFGSDRAGLPGIPDHVDPAIKAQLEALGYLP